MVHFEEAAKVETEKLAGNDEKATILSGRSLPAYAAAEQLANDLRETRPFATGTVIAWESVSSNGTSYSYAAIFANGSWYTTIERSNTYVQPRMTHADLLSYFSERGDHLRNLRVATDFAGVQL